MTICCQTSGGFHRVLAVTSRLRIKHEESARFERLVEMLSAQSPLKYQVLLTVASVGDIKIFHLFAFQYAKTNVFVQL